jgi:hypothetical protein
MFQKSLLTGIALSIAGLVVVTQLFGDTGKAIVQTSQVEEQQAPSPRVLAISYKNQAKYMSSIAYSYPRSMKSKMSVISRKSTLTRHQYSWKKSSSVAFSYYSFLRSSSRYYSSKTRSSISRYQKYYASRSRSLSSISSKGRYWSSALYRMSTSLRYYVFKSYPKKAYKAAYKSYSYKYTYTSSGGSSVGGVIAGIIIFICCIICWVAFCCWRCVVAAR